jgi:hypothetical protein
MLDALLELILECAILLIYIQVIAFVGIVGDIDIRIAISIDISYGDAEAETNESAVDAHACVIGHFLEVSVIVPV